MLRSPYSLNLVSHVAGYAVSRWLNDRSGTLSLLVSRCISLLCIASFVAISGCNFIPDIKHKPQYHNPFPQISKVAVLPFRNQSQEPTLSGARVSMAYYNELQSIRGFEVVPYGVVENQLAYFETDILRHPVTTPMDFQQFAKFLGVDAVLQGAITDYDPYYPPRMTLKVNWYASNPGFHPIPVGYGLPWGTKAEKKIPEWIRLESERALAAEQLKTQTPQPRQPEPDLEPESVNPEPVNPETAKANPRTLQVKSAAPRGDKQERIAAARIVLPIRPTEQEKSNVDLASYEEPAKMPETVVAIPSREQAEELPEGSVVEAPLASIAEVNDGLPANWPDPQGFIPKRPTAQAPELIPQHEPIMSHMRTYNGNDEDFTHALEEYFYFRDDARFGGWQTYLQRSEDFIRFCCHLHIVETLASRGGQLESRMILRWPINRYER